MFKVFNFFDSSDNMIFLLFALLCFLQNTVFPFSFLDIQQQSLPLFCSVDELCNMLAGDNKHLDKDNQYRLNQLALKKDMLFWHLRDPMIGVYKLPTKNYKQSLAWNFTLWDLAPSRGRNVKIAIIDNLGLGEKFSLKRNDEIASNLLNINKKLKSDLFIAGVLKDLTFLDLEKDFFEKKIKKNVAGHGIATLQVVRQLAPDVQFIPIKALDEEGVSNKQDLYKALEEAINEHVDIVHAGLKITEQFDVSSNVLDQKIAKSIDSIKYIVLPSGNDVYEKKLSYPARLPGVVFNVGAYGYSNKGYKICNFSQYEKNIGPNFVAPGLEVFSSVLIPGRKSEDMLMMLEGTSTSAAIMTGFLSLVLSEFQEDFSYNEIIEVICKFTKKFMNQDWQDKVFYGAIDMRSCLLAFHILKEASKNMSRKLFEKKFSKLTQAAFLVIKMGDLFVNRNFGWEDVDFCEDFFIYAVSGGFERMIFVINNLIMRLVGVRKESGFFIDVFDRRLVLLLKNNMNYY